MSDRQKDALETVRECGRFRLALDAAETEIRNSKQANTLANSCDLIKTDLKTRCDTMKKFLNSTTSSLGVLHQQIEDLAQTVDKLMTAILPLEEAITTLRIRQSEEGLKSFARIQNKLLEDEDSKHRSRTLRIALKEIRQERLKQLIEEDLKRAKSFSSAEGKSGLPAQSRILAPANIEVPESMQKDLEDFLKD